MQPASNLPDLVDQLGRTHSPFERLKILIRAWALLRKMTPQERMTVAAQLGLDHADDLVEVIARRSGTQASPALISLIEKAQVKGTPHLPELIADLRDPGKRAERLRQGAQTVFEEVAVPKVAPPAAPPPAAAKPKAPLPPAATAPPPVPPQPPAPPVPPPVSTPAVVAPPAPPPPATAAAPMPAARPVEPVAVSPPKPQPVPIDLPPVAPASRPAETNALAGQLAAASSLTARFHALRRQLAEANGISAEHLRSVIEVFPDGWARRRALLEVVRSGALANVHDGLGLVDTLGADRDRLWCLGALTDSHTLSDSEKEAVLEMAASPVARRRLNLRMRGR